MLESNKHARHGTPYGVTLSGLPTELPSWQAWIAWCLAGASDPMEAILVYCTPGISPRLIRVFLLASVFCLNSAAELHIIVLDASRLDSASWPSSRCLGRQCLLYPLSFLAWASNLCYLLVVHQWPGSAPTWPLRRSPRSCPGQRLRPRRARTPTRAVRGVRAPTAPAAVPAGGAATARRTAAPAASLTAMPRPTAASMLPCRARRVP